MPPEHHLTAQSWTGDVSECVGWVRGQGEAGRKVRCSMQARIGCTDFHNSSCKGNLKLMFNDAMTMGACSESMRVSMFNDRCEQVEGMLARAHACTHTHTHTHTYTHIHTRTHARTHAHTHTHTHTYTHTHIKARTKHTQVASSQRKRLRQLFSIACDASPYLSI